MVKISKKDLIRILCIIYLLCGGSIWCHVPLEAIESKVPRHDRGKIKKIIRKLIAKGLIYEKPHGKGSSYGLPRKGIELVLMYCREQ